MVMADTFSRALDEEDGKENLKVRVIAVHEEMMHKKSILQELKKRQIEISQVKLQEILSGCRICLENDIKQQKKGKFIYTEAPGERVSADILELTRGRLVLNVIDYFSRFLFSKVLVKKDKNEIIKHLSLVNEKIKINTLITDFGKEFINDDMKQWCDKNKITHRPTAPYHKQGNGRVERVNRTVRGYIKKNKGILRNVLKKAVEVYNNSYHRGVGTSPAEAIKLENREKVKMHSKEYAERFKESKVSEKLKINDKVLIRNEVKKDKMSKEFEQEGIVKKVLGDTTYVVVNKKGKEFTRNISQLKALR